MTNQGKVVVGFSLALTICLTISCSYALVFVPPLQARPLWAAGGMGLVGLLLVTLGRMCVGTPDSHDRIALSVSVAAEEHPLHFFKLAGYWGCVLLISVVPAYLLMRQLYKPLVVMARTLPKPEPSREVILPKPTPPPVVIRSFPQLVLRGLICNGARSTAAINGQTLRLGEKIEGAKVVAIERWGVTVEMDGRTKNIILPR